MRHQEMTVHALSCRADEINTDDLVTDILSPSRDPETLRGGDCREVHVFLEHIQSDLGEDYGYRLDAKEIIGVALIDAEDPRAPIEIMTRDEAVDRFGWRWAEKLEVLQ